MVGVGLPTSIKILLQLAFVAASTGKVKVALAVAPAESVTWTVKVKSPVVAVFADPEMVPLVESVKPGGRFDPEARAHV